MVQFVGFGGALLFARLSRQIGTRRAILLSLLIWIAVIVYAYGALRTTSDAWAMGVVIALVLGGSQALSRSLFSRLIPPGHEASFFGLYEIADRGTSWIGPFLFGIVVGATGSYRDAILSLVALFVAGFLLLLVTDTDRAEREARQRAVLSG
jgi:UMF1 family MFS transporter